MTRLVVDRSSGRTNDGETFFCYCNVVSLYVYMNCFAVVVVVVVVVVFFLQCDHRLKG